MNYLKEIMQLIFEVNLKPIQYKLKNDIRTRYFK